MKENSFKKKSKGYDGFAALHRFHCNSANQCYG